MDCRISLLVYLTIFFLSQTKCQVNDSLSYQAPTCISAELLQNCRNKMDKDMTSISINASQELCRIRSEFTKCTEDALCYCRYPSDTLFLSQAYKEMMKIVYKMKQDNCQQYSLNFTVRDEVICGTQDLPDKVQINTTAAFIIQRLITICPQINLCFMARDEDSTSALLKMNYTQFCGNFSGFLNCFEKSACECEIQEDPDIIQVNGFEKSDFVSQCDLIPEFHPPLLEISCGGLCSLKQPGNKCELQLHQNLATAQGDQEKMCQYTSTYGKCFDDIVCLCGFYQNKDYYVAVSIAKFAFEKKQNCSRFANVTFLSSQQGFPCPDDKKVSSDNKKIILNTHEDKFAVAEDALCPGIKKCSLQFDLDSSMAMNNKDLFNICNAMAKEIQCLENVTCTCGLVLTRYAQPLADKRQALISLCNNVIPALPENSCLYDALCNASNPVGECDGALNRTANFGEDPFRQTCLNILDKAACIQQVSCRCEKVNNELSPRSYNIYQLLTDNILHYNVIGCSIANAIDTSQSGFICSEDNTDHKKYKPPPLNWTRSAQKNKEVQDCPAMKVCYDQSDIVESEALYTFDARKMCRNQLNTIKCKEKSVCSCGQYDSRKVDIQKEIDIHNAKCSKYASYGMISTCKETELCQRAQTSDICLEKLMRPDNNPANCYEWLKYISCTYDVTCTCHLLETTNPSRIDMVLVNLARINYLLFQATNCTEAINQMFYTIPEVIINQSFQCFNSVNAQPKLLPLTGMDISTATEMTQQAKLCPEILNCATKYQHDKMDSFYKVDYMAYCVSTSYFIQCIQFEICKCNISNTTEVKVLQPFLLTLFGDCHTVVNPESLEHSSFGDGSKCLVVPPTNTNEPSTSNTQSSTQSSAPSATSDPATHDKSLYTKNDSTQVYVTFFVIVFIAAVNTYSQMWRS